MSINEVVPFLAEADLDLPIQQHRPQWNKGDASSLAARNDVEALTLWVKERTERSSDTRANYIREANRFLLWATDFERKTLSDMTREDLAKYKDFLTSPPKNLCGRKESVESSGWKPFFTETPAPTSVRQSFRVVCSMFGWLKSTGYIKLNPTEGLPSVKANPKWRRRALSDQTIACVIDYLDEMPKKTPTQIRRYHRLRWMFHLFRLTGLRIGELQSAKMGNFFSETRGGKTRSFLDIVGKGNKERYIPVVGDLFDELCLYRSSLGLSPYPTPGETIPLVCGIEERKIFEPITRQALHNAIKYLVEKTVARLEEIGCYEDAAALKQASAHWLRHTYATKLLDSGASLRTARDNLGHASITTTSIYSHSELDSRFDETENLSKPRKN